MNATAIQQAYERFIEKEQRDGGCWLWIGCLVGKKHQPYGQCRVGRERIYAHRLAWILANGPIPEGLFVLHKCDVSRCVRPDHLFLGTIKDNSDDMIAKGRAYYPGRPPETIQGEKSPTAKVTAAQVMEIRQRRENGESRSSLAKSFSINPRSVWQITSRRTWKHLE